MGSKFFLIVTLQFFVSVSAAFCVEGEKTAAENLAMPTARSEFRVSLAERFEGVTPASFEVEKKAPERTKSIAKSILFSAVVPGAGQFYAGSYIKGAVFFVLEVVAVVSQVHFTNKANDYENRFEAVADAEWSEDAYWDWIARVSNGDRNDLISLRKWEGENFSHFLPENKNQQYYENVGKYNQFIMGWRDFREDVVGTGTLTYEAYLDSEFQGMDLGTSSSTRNIYVVIRKDSNDNFRRASTFATVTLFNHVLSALDAGFTARRFNRNMSAEFHIQGMRYEDRVVPALALGVSW